MEKITLIAEKRTLQGKKVNQLRRQGLLPVVIYGHDRKSESLQVSHAEFKKVYAKAEESALISVKVGGKEESALIHGIDVDPVTGVYRHADLYKVNLKEKITTKVPLVFEGVSEAVKELAGVLVKAVDEIEVECLPTEIPKNITVDISKLATFDDVVKVADLSIPKEVKLMVGLEEVVASVNPPRSEAELEALTEEVVEDVQSVEGIKKEETLAEGEEGEGVEGKDAGKSGASKGNEEKSEQPKSEGK